MSVCTDWRVQQKSESSIQLKLTLILLPFLPVLQPYSHRVVVSFPHTTEAWCSRWRVVLPGDGNPRERPFGVPDQAHEFQTEKFAYATKFGTVGSLFCFFRGGNCHFSFVHHDEDGITLYRQLWRTIFLKFGRCQTCCRIWCYHKSVIWNKN